MCVCVCVCVRARACALTGLCANCSHPYRVIQSGTSKTIGPHTFENWGSHSNVYPHSYFTAAAAIGMEKREVDEFAHRLRKCFRKFLAKSTPDSETKDTIS